VLIEAHPANVLDDLEMARALYKHVCLLFDESKSGVRVEGGYGGSLLDLAAREAVKMADYHAGVEDAEERDVRDRAEKLLDALPGIPDDAFLDDMEFTVRQLKSLVEWLARQAGIPPETGTVDGSVIPPEEQLFEIVHTEARYEVLRLEGAAEEVQAQILKKRRERVLPDQADLQTISCYEAHLSRQMYQALHGSRPCNRAGVGRQPHSHGWTCRAKNTKQFLGGPAHQPPGMRGCWLPALSICSTHNTKVQEGQSFFAGSHPKARRGYEGV
jgi:hypothetical protein